MLEIHNKLKGDPLRVCGKRIGGETSSEGETRAQNHKSAQKRIRGSLNS